MRYDAILFDSDGVLVEPTDPEVHRRAVRDAFAEFDVRDVDDDTVDRLVEISGDDRDRLSVPNVRQVCDDYGIDPEAYWRRRELLAADAQYEELKQGRKRAYEDVDTLPALESRGVDFGVVSNNQHETLTYALEHAGIADLFDAVYGREATLDGLRRRKPNTYYAERILAELDAERPLVVGDSVVDVRMADRLGADSVFVRRDHRTDYRLTDEPTYEVEGLRELDGLVTA